MEAVRRAPMKRPMGYVDLMQKSGVVAAFDAAAASYAAAARVQDQVAEALLGGVADGAPKTILDIGCGAGAVTALIAARWPQAEIDALDASPAMLAQVAGRAPTARRFLGDAAAFEPAARYDLIVSSMALHWLPDPRAVLARWARGLAPGGRLHVAVPAAGSLREWREACADAGAEDGLWPFPAEDFAAGLARSAELREHRLVYASARDFLISMKQTGAHSPRRGHRPASAGALRRLLAQCERPFAATYRILYLTV